MDLSVLDYADRTAAKEIIARCMVDRVFYIEYILGVKDIWGDGEGGEFPLGSDETPGLGWMLIEKGIEDWQREVLEALDNGDTKVSIRSAVGVGKTALVSWLASHFLLFRDDVKVVVTSPSFSQLQDGLIPEVRKWCNQLPPWLRAQLDFTADRITRKPDNANNFISFRTARKETPEALQGIHATHVLLLVDEASGVHESVYEAGQGTLSTAGSIAVLIGNPIRVTGLFYKTHRKLKRLWRTWKVTSFQSTRVDPSFPKQIEATYGLNSIQYKVRILGEFPEGNQDSVIPRLWVEQAYEREISPLSGDLSYWGVDPGRGGDPTGFCDRKGRHINLLHELYYEDTMQIVGFVKQRWDELPPSARPKGIFVDVIGLGAGVVDRLQEMQLPVVAVNVSEMASMKDQFVRLRAELWMEGRYFFEKKNCVINQSIGDEIVDKFFEEMSETCFKFHSSGKTDVESKKDLKSRGVNSPNLADAFLLTLASDGAIMNGALGSATDWSKEINYNYKGVV